MRTRIFTAEKWVFSIVKITGNSGWKERRSQPECWWKILLIPEISVSIHILKRDPPTRAGTICNSSPPLAGRSISPDHTQSPSSWAPFCSLLPVALPERKDGWFGGRWLFRLSSPAPVYQTGMIRDSSLPLPMMFQVSSAIADATGYEARGSKREGPGLLPFPILTV